MGGWVVFVFIMGPPPPPPTFPPLSCINDCSYCGIRRKQPGIKRYTMPPGEVVDVARWAHAHSMGTLMLQSGELPTPQRLAYVEGVVRAVRAATVAMDREAGRDDADDDALGLRVALSIGELSLHAYRRLYDAGARRYLLRIETSNPVLFARLHPPAQRWDARVAALRDVKAAGLQLGTGVMVGLPGQTLADLAGDVAFFREVRGEEEGGGRASERVGQRPLRHFF